jgi:hypothetical protein
LQMDAWPQSVPIISVFSPRQLLIRYGTSSPASRQAGDKIHQVFEKFPRRSVLGFGSG